MPDENEAVRFAEHYLRLEKARNGKLNTPIEDFSLEDIVAHMMRNTSDEDVTDAHRAMDLLRDVERKEGNYCARFNEHLHRIAFEVHAALTEYRASGDKNYKEMAKVLLDIGCAFADTHEAYHTLLSTLIAHLNDK